MTHDGSQPSLIRRRKFSAAGRCPARAPIGAGGMLRVVAATEQQI
jgi:hypothetical protein